MAINVGQGAVNIFPPDDEGNDNMTQKASQTIQQSQIQVNSHKAGKNTALDLLAHDGYVPTGGNSANAANPFTTRGGISIGVGQFASPGGNYISTSGNGMIQESSQVIQQSQIQVNDSQSRVVYVNIPPCPEPCPPPTPVPPTPTPVPPTPTPVPPTPTPVPHPTPTQYYPCIGGPSGNQFMFNYLMEDKRIGFFTNDSTPSDTNGPIVYFDQQDYKNKTGYNISAQQAYQQGLIQALPTDPNTGKPILAGAPQRAVNGEDYFYA
jgi:hypothetical protein